MQLSLDLSAGRQKKQIARELAAVINTIFYVDGKSKELSTLSTEQFEPARIELLSILTVEAKPLLSSLEVLQKRITIGLEAVSSAFVIRRFIFGFLFCFLICLYAAAVRQVRRWAREHVEEPLEGLAHALKALAEQKDSSFSYQPKHQKEPKCQKEPKHQKEIEEIDSSIRTILERAGYPIEVKDEKSDLTQLQEEVKSIGLLLSHYEEVLGAPSEKPKTQEQELLEAEDHAHYLEQVRHTIREIKRVTKLLQSLNSLTETEQESVRVIDLA